MSINFLSLRRLIRLYMIMCILSTVCVCIYNVQYTYTDISYCYHIFNSSLGRIRRAPNLREPKYCASGGVSVCSLIQISFLILLYNRRTCYHRMQRLEEGRRSCCRHPTRYERYGGGWTVGGGEARLGVARFGATMRAAAAALRKAYSHTGQQCR